MPLTDSEALLPIPLAEATDLLERVAGRPEPDAAGLVTQAERIPAAIEWLGRRLRWSDAAAVRATLAHLGGPRARHPGPLDAFGRTLWRDASPDTRTTWLAVGLGAGRLAEIEAVGGTLDAVTVLGARHIVRLESQSGGARVTCPAIWAHAAFAAADPDGVGAVAGALADGLDASLAADREAWHGPDGPSAAARLRAARNRVERLVEVLSPRRVARLILHLTPVLEDAADGDGLLIRAMRAAEAATDRSAAHAARVALARWAGRRGAFAAAERWLAGSDPGDDVDGEGALVLGHTLLRQHRFAEAARHLDRAARRARLDRHRLAVDAQRALALSLQGRRAESRALLESVVTRADATGALRLGALARWHLGAAAVDGPDPLYGVANLERAVRLLTAFGDGHIELVTRGFIARGLRRAGCIEDAGRIAADGHGAARARGLVEAEADCAVEMLELAQGRARFAARLAVLEALPGGRRPATLRRARAALDRVDDRSGPTVAADGRWIEPIRGPRVDLGRRVANRRILAHLVAARWRDPQAAVPVEILFRVGWPDTCIRPESRARRVYTAIWQLRDAGLGDALVCADGGYRLDEGLIVESVESAVRHAAGG